MKKILSIFLCLAIVIGFIPHMASAAPGDVTLVTDLSTLESGDQVIIVGYDNTTDKYYAMSTTQNEKNRGQVEITKEGDKLVLNSNVQVITVGAGTAAGTYSLGVDGGYLYAAGGTGKNNFLKTNSTHEAVCDWNITVDPNGVATIKAADATIARNWLRWNKTSSLFSCYGSGQQDVYIYEVEKCNHSSTQTALDYSYTKHWKTCDTCSQSFESGSHTGTDSCTECGFTADLSTVAGVEAATKILASDEKLSGVSMTGTVIRVDYAYSTQYENISVTVRFTDNSGSVDLYCYQMKAGDGANVSTLKVNDTLTVTGDIALYKGTPQFSKNCTATNIVAGTACDHTDLQWHDEDGMHWQTCKADGCVYTTAKAAHKSTDTEWSHDDNGHYHICDTCEAHIDVTTHTPGVDDKSCVTALLCTECGHEITAAKTEHTLVWNDTAEAGKHFQECTEAGCDYKTEACAGALEQVDDGTTHHDKCTVCEYVSGAKEHSYPSTGTAADYSSSKDGHYQICACGHTTTLAAHEGPDADGKCTVCGYKMTCDHEDTKKDWDETNHWDVCQAEDCKQPLNTQKHTMKGDKNDTHHWQYCDCGYKTTEVKHDLKHKSDATHHWTECACGYATTKEEHTFTANSDETNHWSECKCGDKKDSAAHEFAPKYDETSHWQECACGAKKDIVAHTLEKKYDETQHWTECACGYASTKEAHTEPKNECACGYKPAPTEVVITYDFSKLEANGNEIGVDETDPIEALTLFKKAATNSKYLKKVSTTKIYRGSTNGGGLEGKDGYLKLGTSKAQGQIVLTYAEGVKVTKVEIYCHDWYAKTDKYPTNSNTVSVNGSEGQLAPYNETGAVGMLTFELAEASNVLTIDSNKRVFISKIVVYTEVTEEANDGTGDMFGVVLTALVVSGMGITVLKKKEF